MKLPSVISKMVLRDLAAPNETHAVRVLLHEVNNGSVYRLRTARRQYLFEKNGVLGIHALDIPVSCWMEGTTPGRYRENHSISQDFRTAGAVKWSVQIVPWGTAAAGSVAEPRQDFLPLLRKLLSNLGAPPEVVTAFELIDAGDLTALGELVALTEEDAPATTPPPVVPPMAPADRAQKMRDAKAAKKAARLQPA